MVKLNLKKPGFDESVTINALSFPVLCSPLPSKINIDCPHLKGLELADNWDQTDCSIDLLIGSDQYWDIVTGETRVRETGPVAVKSSLGWLLSGPVTSTANNIGTHSNLIISRPAEAYSISTNDTNLVKMIEKFWNTESIGIKEPALPECEIYSIRTCHTRTIDTKSTYHGRRSVLQITTTLAIIVLNPCNKD